jgi:CDP-diacylglycerol pyrophosphatase
MRDNDEATGLTRRQFVQLSGVAGASGILIAAGRNLAAAQPCLPGGPDPDPSTCGNPNDTTEQNWTAVQNCLKGQGNCLQKGTNSVVLKGETPRDFITVPTKRINGIECPWIADSGRPNYWQEAWDWAHKSSTTVNGPVGLGINSPKARQSNQLHIHMATVRDYSQQDLSGQDGATAPSFDKWHATRVAITGWNAEGKHQSKHLYRVVHVSSFGSVNLFEELRKVVGQANMKFQTLIVIPRKGGGFYIVNSQADLSATDPKLKGLTGSDTCDPLLKIKPGG